MTQRDTGQPALTRITPVLAAFFGDVYRAPIHSPAPNLSTQGSR